MKKFSLMNQVSKKIKDDLFKYIYEEAIWICKELLTAFCSYILRGSSIFFRVYVCEQQFQHES